MYERNVDYRYFLFAACSPLTMLVFLILASSFRFISYPYFLVFRRRASFNFLTMCFLTAGTVSVYAAEILFAAMFCSPVSRSRAFISGAYAELWRKSTCCSFWAASVVPGVGAARRVIPIMVCEPGLERSLNFSTHACFGNRRRCSINPDLTRC